MSKTIVEKVKDFLIRLVKDESFRIQLTNKKVEEVKKVLADSGYTFSQNEFEKAAIKILEFKELGEFHDLTEEELVGAVGGYYNVYANKDVDIDLDIDQDFDVTIDLDKVIELPDDPGIYGIAMYGAVIPPDAISLEEYLKNNGLI
ncbi:MAG: Nif11-like leader peptide family natural product precursor [Calothrix sp. MO_167.B12]|nr:Nif11-like leader peptide family natural product precursor [Calothrix sp. MO_167.B12]